jgi:hypothetical protein
LEEQMQSHATAGRTRRSLFKAATITLGAIAAVSTGGRRASADGWGGWGGGGHGHGRCFLRGTCVRTVDGFRTIESLSVGDLLPTRSGTLSAVSEVRSFALRRGADGSWPTAQRPVLVKEGAFADGSPRRDLCLTAAHAVFVDGLLVPVGNLVNGTTITFYATDREELEFFHVVLEGHDVIDAECAPCESYRADGEQPCVPLVTFNGGRDELKSRLRSAASFVIDRRQPIDVIRDTLEERGLQIQRMVA